MSYAVDVVSGDAPATYEDAHALCNALAEARDARLGAEHGRQHEAASPPMIALHDALTARHPCIVQDERGPWSDGPLINNFGQRIATLGIVYSRADEVLPFLIQTATGMGFWVLDQQDQAVHLPGGQTVRPRSKPWWKLWIL